MGQYKKKVVCIYSDQSFLKRQNRELKDDELDHYFFPFRNFTDAYRFLEQQAEDGKKVHYLLIEEKQLKKPAASFNKLLDLNGFMKNMEVIFLTPEDRTDLRNQVMQYRFVSAYLVRPVPDNYIHFLIEGEPTEKRISQTE